MNTWKLMQRRCYDLLSNKYSLLVTLVAFTCIFIGIVHFGEVWLAWSKEKYEAVFHSFNDNILGTSFQKKLCQHVPIDVVYTWVNGSDPEFLENLKKYIPISDINVAASRFDDKDELRYSLRSLEMYAPWVRHVYIVTNGQVPSWLDMDNPRMTLIVHEDIFLDENHLPTFSSPAIESHIHRIPGLSEKFLYFNDDILLGTEVWPEDFFTKSNGQKVYLAWWVPDCSEVCPWAWVGDGACDPACNTTLCEFDGGDCKQTSDPLDSELMDYGSDYPPHFLHENRMRDQDAARILEILKIRNSTPSKALRNGTVSRSLKSFDHNIPESGKNINSSVLQSSFIRKMNQMKPQRLNKRRMRRPKKYHLKNILAPDSADRDAYVREFDPLHVSYPATPKKAKHSQKQQNARVNPHNVVSKVENNYLNAININANKNKATQVHNVMYNVESQHSTVTKNSLFENSRDVGLHNTVVRRLLNVTNITKYNKSTQLRSSYHQTMGDEKKNSTRFERRKQLQRYLNDDLINLIHLNDSMRSAKYAEPEEEFEYENGDVQPSQWKHASRKLDTYAESLLYVNKIYNVAYRFERRRVPAHMPHLLDKTIIKEMQQKFNKEFISTSSHRVRNSKDMQFAFSYFYFLMSEVADVPIETIFDAFDTDKSGTWSDREIRTLLSKIYPLPLHYNLVMEFENRIINCSKHLQHEDVPAVPPGERYLDSTLPVVTKKLIMQCDSIVAQINSKFGKTKRYPHEQFKGDRSEVFKMLTSNVSLTVQILDEIRREGKKFICLNDNMDPTRQSENELVRVVLGDFYRSMYPLKSSFELPAQYRNRFAHRRDLIEWRTGRAQARNLLLCLLTLLLLITIYHLFYHQGRRLLRFRPISSFLV